MVHRITLVPLLVMILLVTSIGISPALQPRVSLDDPMALAASGATSAEYNGVLPQVWPARHQAAATGVTKLAAPPAGAIDCASIWEGGIPRTGTGLTYCLEHWNEKIGGSDYRILYPFEWSTDADGGWGSGYLDLTVEAFRKSVGVYGALGTMAPITLVFSRLEYGGPIDGDEKLIVAEAGYGPCSVFISPRSLELTLDHFNQLIAHELFHCFQDFNFDLLAEDASNKWWVEGSAEYFSNVVYPAANLEWKLTSPFDATSPNTPITQYTYAACFFFQFLGNTLGNPGVIAFLDTLPGTGGEAAQQAAIAGWEGMEDLFQQFAQQYLDVKLLDSSGAAIPFNPIFAPVRTLNVSGAFDVNVPAFVIQREEIAFEGDLTFTFGIEPSSGPSRHALRTDGGAWGTAPALISCDDARVYKAAYTSIGDGSTTPAVITGTVSATESDCDETDTCLVGDWQIVDYETFLQAALDLAGATNGPAPITFDGASGDLWFTFDEDTITYSASEFELDGSTTVQGMAVSVTIRLDGEATAGYDVIEEGTIDLIELDTAGFTVEAETFLDGASMGITPIEPDQWIFFLSPTYGYACTESSLDLTIPPLTIPVVLVRSV
ncbi:MAG TPA: hypothetical protein VEW66_01890 [Thermomicrobiales bacterium]|nr:hypothetical protein [Thermomicrobiales bacterium]